MKSPESGRGVRSEPCSAIFRRVSLLPHWRSLWITGLLSLCPSFCVAIHPDDDSGSSAAIAAQRTAARVELAPRPPTFVETRASADANALERLTGDAWRIAWNPYTNLARRGWGGRARSSLRLPEADLLARAQTFRQRHARLLGAEGVTLRTVRWRRSGESWHATWQQWHAGRRVVGSLLDLTLLDDGTVVAFRSTLLPHLEARAGAPALAAAEQACESLLGDDVEVISSEPVWVADATKPQATAVEALDLRLARSAGARWRAIVGSSDAEVLQFESMVRTSQLTGTTVGRVKPQYAQDRYVEVALPWLEIQLGFTETDPHTFADERGSFQFVYPEGNVTVRSSLTGRFVSIDNQAAQPTPSFQSEVAVPGDVEVRFGAAESRADERTIYYHVNRIHDTIAERFGLSLLDFPVPALAAVNDPNTGDPNYPNAFWDGEKLGFGNGGNTFWNLGLFEDVVYHEYTHAITEFMYQPAGDLVGAIGGAIHEALADYFAATLTDDPRLGENLFRRTPAPLRNLDNSLVWPNDRDETDEPHGNGAILGGAFWDLRVEVGPEVADPIVHFARDLFPRTFDEYLDAALLQDDLLFGDGWPGNGSPHRDAILAAFALHGIGPLADTALKIVHTPLRDTDNPSDARRVRASIDVRLKDTKPFVRLSYRLSADEEFTHMWMEKDTDGSFVAELPALPNGSDVDYYIAAGQFEPVMRLGWLPLNAPDETFLYHVGRDESPPRITHAPRATVASFSWPPDVHVRIEDNVGVAYAYVEYRLNGEPGATLGLAPTRDDPNLYRTRIPNVGGNPGDVLVYWITAVDASEAAHVTRFPARGAVQVTVVDDLQDGFESDQGTWTHSSVVTPRVDAWKLTDAWNHTPGGQRAWLCGAEAGGYAAGIAAQLVTDWYRVDAGALARVWSWIEARTAGPGEALDGGRVEIQVENGAEWSPLVPRGGYTHVMSLQSASNALVPGSPALSGHDPAWHQLEFDLDPWARQRIRLRFLYGSVQGDAADGEHGHGWLLDDFEIIAGEVDPTDVGVVTSPSAFRVRAAPNPFNPRVRLRIDVPGHAGQVLLDVVDARGRFVRRLLDARPQPGALDVIWDGTDAAGLASSSGVYYYRLHSKLGLETGKLVLVR